MRKAFERRRDLIVKLAKEHFLGLKSTYQKEHSIYSQNAAVSLAKQWRKRPSTTQQTLHSIFLKEAHVATVGGDAFGDQNALNELRNK